MVPPNLFKTFIGMVRFIKVVSAIIVFIFVLAGLFMMFVAEDMCGNEIYQEIFSPNAEYKVVVFERSCGASTGFSTQVSILAKQKKLSNNSGNVFIAEGRPSELNLYISWSDNDTLIINDTSNLKVYHASESVHNIKILYK